MGYFNIFYKITRIIDMLTRKRNRKAIMVILIIIAIVFLFTTKSRADFTGFDSTNLGYIQQDVDNIDFNLGLMKSDLNTAVQRLYFIMNRLDIANTNLSTIMSNTAEISGKLTGLNNQLIDIKTELEAQTDIQEDIYDEFLALQTRVDTLISNTNTLIIEANNIYDKLVDINTNIMHYGNMAHDDAEDIKEMLREYLYGDAEEFDVSKTNFKNLFFDNGNPIIRQVSSPASLIVLRVRSGYTYDLNFTSQATWDYSAWSFKTTNYIKPVAGLNLSSYTLSAIVVPTQSQNYDYIFTADYDGYLYFSFWDGYLSLNSIVSNYNEGQEQGIYGGLTIVDQQVQHQGETINDSITSTNYEESDVNINTDSVSNIDTSQTDGLFTTIFNNFNSAATGGVDSITIPLPHNSGNIVLYSNVVSSHLGNLSALVSAFWYFVFGLYAFKFVNNLLHSIKDGSILDGFKHNNEVITSDML